MKNFLLLFSLTLFAFSSPAQAGFLLEPYMGMHLNSSYTDNDCASDCSKSISGIAIGGRAGFQNLGFMFGVSGKRVSYDVEDATSGDLATTTIGVFPGYDFPILLRVWGEYILSGTGAWDDSSSNQELNVASGTTLGVGYKIFPFISLNLEVGSIKFDETTYDGGSNEIDTDFNTYMLGISVPLSL